MGSFSRIVSFVVIVFFSLKALGARERAAVHCHWSVVRPKLINHSCELSRRKLHPDPMAFQAGSQEKNKHRAETKKGGIGRRALLNLLDYL